MGRGHLKTTVSSVLRILHTLYVNPNVRIFIGCLPKSLSNSIMREVQAFLLDEWNQENVWNNRLHIEGRLIPVMDKLGKQRRYQRKYEEDTLDSSCIYPVPPRLIFLYEYSASDIKYLPFFG